MTIWRVLIFRTFTVHTSDYWTNGVQDFYIISCLIDVYSSVGFLAIQFTKNDNICNGAWLVLHISLQVMNRLNITECAIFIHLM